MGGASSPDWEYAMRGADDSGSFGIRSVLLDSMFYVFMFYGRPSALFVLPI
jgi:hypothetical protein